MTEHAKQPEDATLLLPREITLKLSSREDGGVRICSEDVPGLILSSRDISGLFRDLPVVLTDLIAHNGIRDGCPQVSGDFGLPPIEEIEQVQFDGADPNAPAPPCYRVTVVERCFDFDTRREAELLHLAIAEFAALSRAPQPETEAEYRIGAAYQVIGALLDRLGAHDSEKGQRLLDYFAWYEGAADPLPFDAYTVAPRVETVTEATVEAALQKQKYTIVPAIETHPQTCFGATTHWTYRGEIFHDFEKAKDAQQKEILRAALTAALNTMGDKT